MDPYSLKHENRKKFQDKEKLKRRHATPSDRKYRTIHRNAEAEAAAAEQEAHPPKPLESNEHRYTSEALIAEADDSDLPADLSAKMKKILQEKRNDVFLKTTPVQSTSDRFTKKQIEQMSVAEMNDILLQRKIAQETPISSSNGQKEKLPAYTRAETTNRQQEQKQLDSHVPEPLKSDEDFLDSFI